MKGIILIMLGVLALHASDFTDKTLLERLVHPKVSYSESFLSDAKLKGEEASVSTRKHSLKINNEIAAFEYSRWDFDWKGQEDLSFGNGVNSPIRRMHRLKLSGTLPKKLNERWFWLSSVNAGATFERETEDSLSYGLFTFLSYKIDDDHTLQFGGFGSYHPVASMALPVLSYSYRARKRDGFTAVLGFPRSYLGYRLSPSLQINAGMIYSQAVIRLADDNALSPRGYLEANDYMGNMGVRCNVTETIELNADLLYAFKREFTRYDHRGDPLNRVSIDPSVGAMIRLRYLF
jgi:hypothetical protein